MLRKKRVGIYLDSGTVIRNPDYLKALGDELGLNLVILNYSGELPSEILLKSPYDGTPPSDGCIDRLVARHIDGDLVDTIELDQVRAAVGPTHSQGNDGPLRQAIQVIHDAGMEIWACCGSWTIRRLMFCPSNEATNDWYEAKYCYIATQYGIEGLDISHARYPMGSFPRGLFCCCCTNCARAAADMGYDMQDMVAALEAGRKRLASIDPKLLAGAARFGMGPFDFIQMLELPAGIVDWFRFRARLLGIAIKRYRSAVHDAAGNEFIFGSDTYPASLSMFMGHDHAAWAEFSDFASPLVSHIHQFVVLTLVSWANFLQELNPSLSEADALQIVYSFVGYDQLGLPESEAGFNHDDIDRMIRSIPLKDIILHDLNKARICLSDTLPSYPIIHGEGWPLEEILGIIDGAGRADHDGIIFQGTAELLDFELD